MILSQVTNLLRIWNGNEYEYEHGNGNLLGNLRFSDGYFKSR